MALMGAEIRFDKDKCLVLKDGKEFVIGCLLHDKLYSTQKDCRSRLFQNRVNTGQPNHMKLCTVMYVAQCKWNQKVVVDTCLPSQGSSRHTTAYFIKSKSELLSKFMEYVNSVEKYTGSHKTEDRKSVV